MGRKSKKRALQGVQGAVSRAAKRRTAGDNVPKSSAFGKVLCGLVCQISFGGKLNSACKRCVD